jgi:hypothetical protein
MVLASVLVDNMILAAIICAAILGREEELRGDWPLYYIVALATFVMRGLLQWERQNAQVERRAPSTFAPTPGSASE